MMWNSIIDQYKSKAMVACDQNYFTDFPQNAHGNIYIEFYIYPVFIVMTPSESFRFS